MCQHRCINDNHPSITKGEGTPIMSVTTRSPDLAVDENPFAGFGGQTREIDTRTANIPSGVLRSLDNAVAHFAVRENKKQLEVTMPDVASAELLADQIRRYSLANGVSCSTLECVGTVVFFRFAKPRTNGDSGDEIAVADSDAVDEHTV